jgi:hypothetical protein
MNPQRRQILLQWLSITSAPHISQRGATASRFSWPLRIADSLRGRRTMGTGGKSGPSFFVSMLASLA